MARMMVMLKRDYLRVLAVLLAIVLAILLSATIMVQTAPPAMADDSRCVGVLTGPHDNVVVPPGAPCVLNNAQVKGNVKALENSRLLAILGNNTVQGSVYGDKAEIVQFNNSTVRGNIEIKEGEVNDGGLDVNLTNTTVQEGNVKIEKMAGEVIVNRSPVQKGNLQLFENLTVTGLLGIRVANNEVAQDLQFFKNRGPSPKVVAGNTVGENLQCFENDPPFIGQPNVAKKAEGQCGATQSPSSASAQSTDAEQDEELEAALEENQRVIDSLLEEAKASS